MIKRWLICQCHQNMKMNKSKTNLSFLTKLRISIWDEIKYLEVFQKKMTSMLERTVQKPS